MEERRIGYIKNGIVIDHLKPSIVWNVARILGVDKQKTGRISLGDNYESKKLGKKSFIKIEERELTDYEINLIALVAPDAIISIIKDGKVESKRKSIIPDVLKNIALCPNTSCITNDEHEQVNPLVYYKEGKFMCHYCEHAFSSQDLKIKGD